MPEFTDVFDPSVTAFQTHVFHLLEDLLALGQHRKEQAPVATILHCTRILEVLTRDALTRAGLAVSPNTTNEAPRLVDMMRQLREYERMPSQTYRLLDRLRALGNSVRHVLDRVTMDDAEHGYAIILHGLHWYFCLFPDGPKLNSLCVHDRPLDQLLPLEIARLLHLLESNDLAAVDFLDHDALSRRSFLLSPVLTAVLVEVLLDANRTAESQGVLTDALERFPLDIRLRQLQGLLHSRAGRLDEACALLKSIEGTDSAADEETHGILGGIYKRRSVANPEQSLQWLRACRDHYDHGWNRSRETNVYLGINAAATALWLGNPERTTTIAASIRDRLSLRREKLRSSAGDIAYLHCWDQLTLAEAHLLLGEWDASRNAYAEACEHFPMKKQALQVAFTQVVKNLNVLNRADLIESFRQVLIPE